MRHVLQGLDCPSCAAEIEAELRKVSGLEDASLNFATRSVRMDPVRRREAQEAIDSVKPGILLVPEGETDDGPELRRTRSIIIAAIAAFAAGAVLHYMQPGPPGYALLLTAYLLTGERILRRAFANLRSGVRIFDENFLMTVATLGAVALGELPEAAAVMLFYRTGEYLQSLAVGRSRRSVRALMQLRPDFARVRRGDSFVKVAPETVEPGTTIIVQPGERIPLDGRVVHGSSSLNTSALTGEAIPRAVRKGDEVLSGMMNEDGVLEILTEREYARSAVARIMDLVEEAAARKAPVEKFITRFARYYTPAVVIAALALALLPPLILADGTFATWGYRALVLLVISCPCALVISVPMGYFAGIGLASRNGILVKGANFLDALDALSAAVFDKTGTLTDGEFTVRSIEPARGYSEGDVLTAAAAAEAHSSHPIAGAIRRRFREMKAGPQSALVELAAALTDEGAGTARIDVDGYRDRPGHGVLLEAAGHRIAVGNRRLMMAEDIDELPIADSTSTIYVACDGHLLGTIRIADGIREGAVDTVRDLRARGIHTFMLTGDTTEAAETAAHEVGVDDFRAELLPEDKVKMTEQLQDELGGRVMFVGDGINDAPVIARADVGVAMGGLGSDAAIESADVVIMDDRLQRLSVALSIARITRGVVTQNVVMALGFKLVFLVLGAAGLTTMWGAVFADVGVTLLAVGNSARILRTRVESIL